MLLASTQVFAAGCDLRCSLMVTASPSGHFSSHSEMKMAHCHHIVIDSGTTANFFSNDSCQDTGCESDLPAAVKNTEQKNADASDLQDATVALFASLPEISQTNRVTPSATLNRRSDSRPLASRPGSSLRI